jgi:hypothetical protein
MKVKGTDYDGGLHSMKRLDQAIFLEGVGTDYEDIVCCSALRRLITL